MTTPPTDAQGDERRDLTSIVLDALHVAHHRPGSSITTHTDEDETPVDWDEPETWPQPAIKTLNRLTERAHEDGRRSGIDDYRQSLKDEAADQAEQALLCQKCSVNLDMVAPEWCSTPNAHRRPVATHTDTAAQAMSTSAARESVRDLLAPHRPVVDPQGRAVGCQCMDRVFVRHAEDYSTHLAEVVCGGFVDTILSLWRVDTIAAHTDTAAQAGAQALRDAEVWDEASEVVMEWAANNPGPSGIPHDPPVNPYAARADRLAAQAPAPTPGRDA